MALFVLLAEMLGCRARVSVALYMLHVKHTFQKLCCCVHSKVPVLVHWGSTFCTHVNLFYTLHTCTSFPYSAHI